MKKTKLACPVSNLDVLEAISDQLSIDIITTISKHPTNPDNLMQMLGITRKQYYTRTSRLLKIGVISRKHGDIILTSFGRLVYKAQSKIATAFSLSSELRMIDVIKSHSGMSEDEQKKIMHKLLDKSELKNIVLDDKKKWMVIYTSAKPVKHIGDRTITNVNIIPKGAEVRTIKSETVKDYSNRSEWRF